jgi:AcrR family transcriptional regulator
VNKGTTERRERERAEQRQRILDAALHIITQEGFTAMTMRKLAERIEYSPAAIYLHFQSREEIARHLS